MSERAGLSFTRAACGEREGGISDRVISVSITFRKKALSNSPYVFCPCCRRCYCCCSYHVVIHVILVNYGVHRSQELRDRKLLCGRPG